MKDLVKRAFLQSRAGYSVDRVLADPTLNIAFLTACGDAITAVGATELNRRLLNLRKSSSLANLNSKRTTIHNQGDFAFACEIAVRFLERRDGVTLDDVICDPRIAQEFDKLAARIAPGYMPLQYRWAALSLRKKSKLSPELLSRIVKPLRVEQFPVADLKIEQIPASQGLYLFFESKRSLYVGEAVNLRKRITKHLQHSDNRGLARWLWEQGESLLFLEYHVLPDGTSTKVRKAMELELIRQRRPYFNVLGRIASKPTTGDSTDDANA